MENFSKHTMIEVNNISKCYRIGLKNKTDKTLCGTILDGLVSPLKNIKRLRSLTNFKDIQSSKNFNSQPQDVIWALDDISFKVKKGEVIGIIGPNGAGKSTLLKILSRITEPSSGNIKLYGRVSSLLEVGTGFHPELTGRENIYLNGTILGMSRKEINHKFDEIVAFSEIGKFLDTPVKRYSSGMYVRLAFAVAAHLDPEIFLVDEVLSVGDYRFQEKCLGKMQDVTTQGRTVLFVSHNMKAVSQICTRTLLIKNGKLIDSGDTNRIISLYTGRSKSQPAKKSWKTNDAPGNHSVKLLEVSARDKNDNVKSTFRYDEPIQIKVKFEVLNDSTNLYLRMYLENENRIDVFVTTLIEKSKYQKGIHEAKYSPFK